MKPDRPEPRYANAVHNLWPPSEPESLDSLLEAAEAVKALEASPGWAVVRKILVNEIVSLDRAIERDGGREISHSQLTHLLGRRAAHRELQEVLDSVGFIAERRLVAAQERAAQAQAAEARERDFDAEERAADELVTQGA
jgi:hypothetical protein